MGLCFIMRLVILIFTLFFGKKIGHDQYGNVYYASQFLKKQKRWVLYKGKLEASKIPANWEMWLRFIIDVPLINQDKFFWQKDHIPNLTGTNFALYSSKQKNIIKTHNHYKAWKQ